MVEGKTEREEREGLKMEMRKKFELPKILHPPHFYQNVHVSVENRFYVKFSKMATEQRAIEAELFHYPTTRLIASNLKETVKNYVKLPLTRPCCCFYATRSPFSSTISESHIERQQKHIAKIILL